MECPIGTIIDEGEIDDDTYERFLREHMAPESVWRWRDLRANIDGPATLTFRVISVDESGVIYDLLEGSDTEIYRSQVRHWHQFGPDPGWTLERLDESDWLLMLMGVA